MSAAPETTAMDRWVLLFSSRDDMAETYAELLSTLPLTSPIFVTLNLAIIDRWSESGLEYIKRRAWKIVGEGDKT